MVQFLVQLEGEYDLSGMTSILSVGGVNLPSVDRVIDRHDVSGEDFEVEGGDPVIITRSNKARVLTLTGSIFEEGKTKANLKDDYLDPLEELKGNTATVLDTRGIYTGTWYVQSVQFTEVAEGDNVARFSYRLVLKQGSDYVRMTGGEGAPW